MIHLLHFHPITASAVVIFALALLKGGAPERLGSLAMVLEWAGEVVCDRFGTFHSMAIVPTLFLDVSLAVSLLVLALRFGRLWLGAAMMLQSVTLAMHSMVLSDDAPGYYLYAACLNVTTCLLLTSLLSGAISSWRRRVAARGATAHANDTAAKAGAAPGFAGGGQPLAPGV